MAKVVVDLEVNDNGSQKVTTFSANMRDAGVAGAEAGAAIGVGMALAENAIAAALKVLQGIPAALRDVVATASRFQDLSDKLDMSAQSAQKLSYMASLSGVSMDTMSAASLKLQKNLAEHPELFKKWGLSAQELRDMKPEEQIAAISDAVRSLGDRESQVALVTELMGKGGAANLGFLRQNMSDLNQEADQLGVAMSDKLVSQLDDVDDAATKLAKSWEGLKNQLLGTLIVKSGMADFFTDLAHAIGAINNATKDNADLARWLGYLKEAMTYLNPIMTFNKAVIHAAGFGIGMIGDTTPAVRKGQGISSTPDSIDFGGIDAKALEVAKTTLKTGQKEIQDLKKGDAQIDRLLNDSRIRAMNEFSKQVDEDHKHQMQEGERFLTEQERLLNEDMRMREAYYSEVTRDGEEFVRSWEEQQRREAQANKDLQAFGASIADLGEAMGSSLVSGIGKSIQSFLAFNQAAFQAEGTAQKVTVAVQGLASAYKSGSVLGGAATGAGIGLAFGGPIGAVAGGLIGGIAGLFGKHDKEKQELAELQQQYLTLMASARQAGTVLNQTFNPKSVHDYKSAIDAVKKAMDTQSQAQQALQDALGRYNFTEKEKGAALAAADLDKKFGQLYQDYQVLNKAGVDHNAIVREMGPSLSQYVNEAKQAGVEVPSAMKEMIDAAIQNGQLLDENGNAYKSAEDAGIHYAETMTQMVQDMVSAVKELVDALNGIPSHRTTTITVNTQQGGMPAPEEEGGGRGFATGYFNPSLSRNMTLRAHRGERVEITPAANSIGTSGSNRRAAPVVHMNGPISITGGNATEVLAGLSKAVERGHARALVTALRKELA